MSGIVRICGSLLRNCQSVLPSSYITLHFLKSVCEGSNLCTSLLPTLICLFDFSHPSECDVVLISISLMAYWAFVTQTFEIILFN